jgi:hypothetical protein
MFDKSKAFAAIRDERITNGARAAIDIAEALYPNNPEQARMWIARALDLDKAHGDAELERQRNARRQKGRVRAKAKEAAEIARAGNVLPMTRAGEDTV